MIIESMPAPNKASATALLERQIKIDVQSEADLELLRTLRAQLVTVEQTMQQANAVLHRILGRVPLDIEAIFAEAKTPQEKSDREDRLWSNPNKQVWYSLQSAVHFASGVEGDIPVGSDVPNRGGLVLQCRHLVAEVDAAINRYEEALKN
jgi:hypothetical protein